MRNLSVQGIILAAGFGTRLRPLTNRIPKAVVEVDGKPLIFYALENMIRAKVSRVVINTHYLSEALKSVVNSRSWPMQVLFSHEPQILGTGGGIKKAMTLLSAPDAVLVQNADGLIQANCEAIFKRHESTNPLATMVLKTVKNPREYGEVLTDDDDMICDINGSVGFSGSAKKRRMFCGMQLLSPEIVKFMPNNKTEFCILKDTIIPALRDRARVASVENPGFFCDVGTPERLAEAEAFMRNQSNAQEIERFS